MYEPIGIFPKTNLEDFTDMNAVCFFPDFRAVRLKGYGKKRGKNIRKSY